MNTTINIILFGIGNVGSTLINQVLASAETISEKQQINLEIPVIANSTTAFFRPHGVKNNWQTDFEEFGFPYTISEIINYISAEALENVIIVDATASEQFVDNYLTFAKHGYHIVTANKIANTLSQEFYEKLRKKLRKHHGQFEYETNVGAGLPVIETIRQLHQSGDMIHKIRGVFSGSLSYIFNTFSEETKQFSQVLKDAGIKGYTEPDAREDLSGKDVARKLLILAREIGLKKEFSDVDIQSLLPSALNGQTTLTEFKNRLVELDNEFETLKNNSATTEALRYIGELDVQRGSLSTKLVSESKESAIGQLKGADAVIEIYTESYREQPLVIQGAGAGNVVTARGVLIDVIKIAKLLSKPILV